MSQFHQSIFDPLLHQALKVTEAAAIASYFYIGRGDEKKADQAAVDAMRKAFDTLPIQGKIVIGEGERDKAPMLYIGEKVGMHQGPEIDIAVDPLEGTTLTAKNHPNAISVMALAERGNLLEAPDVYMEKIAIGPNLPKDLIDITASPQKNIKELAKAVKKNVEDLTICVLERPRHQELIAKIRETGARLTLINDGDVAAIMATCLPNGGVDLYLGSGGAPEGVLAAASLATLGGQMQAQLLFDNEDEKQRAFKLGLKDLNHIYKESDLAKGDVLFIASGVTNGSLLKGVSINNGIQEVHSLVLHSFAKATYTIKSNYTKYA
ncbi:MAG: class II fructose-bisphosphatase [Alphaproteobacteria bacterium]|nr:class II fructose-bisphosphatase [Alphaproteobacteria bacterium]